MHNLPFTKYNLTMQMTAQPNCTLYSQTEMVNCKCPYFLSELQMRVFISFTRFSSSFITLRS